MEISLDIIQQTGKEAEKAISSAKSREELEKARIQYLGKQGKITELFKHIGTLAPEVRKQAGRELNTIKSSLESKLQNTLKSYQQSTINNQQLNIDVTMPGEKPPAGNLHPITQTINEIESIFHKLGFVRRRYPEIETDWRAFGSLNMPENHPARDEWETFYVKNPKQELVLTPHTSSGQVREMKKMEGKPVRMINISRCDRRQIDISHVPTLYQFEGLVIDQGINITHLKGTLDFFVREYFGKDTEYRLRPYDFRFTEPSFEIDITCTICGGKGCRACTAGWMELGGSGMVHPAVLKNGGYDPNEVTGFAFGWGVERVFMMRANLPDIRLLYEGDLRVLKQF